MCQKVMKIQNGRGFITEKGEPATLIKEFSTQEEAVKALEYLRKNKDK